MPRKKKLATPDWILEGYDSEETYNRLSQVQSASSKSQSKPKEITKKKKAGKTFKIKECPKCGSGNVGVVLGEAEGKGSQGWECHKCDWSGNNIIEKELTEDELMEYMDKKGEEVA